MIVSPSAQFLERHFSIHTTIHCHRGYKVADTLLVIALGPSILFLGSSKEQYHIGNDSRWKELHESRFTMCRGFDAAFKWEQVIAEIYSF